MCVYIYMYIKLNHFAVHQKLTKHHTSIKLQFVDQKKAKKKKEFNPSKLRIITQETHSQKL